MPIVKIRTNRQVTIPKSVFDQAGLQEGEFVEVTRTRDQIVIRPKALVDRDDVLTPEDEKLVRKGEAQLKRGKSAPWRDVKKRLGL